MNEEILTLQKKTRGVDRLLQTAKAETKKLYESKRDKYISQLGELAHLDPWYLYSSADPDIRRLQGKICQVDKQLVAPRTGTNRRNRVVQEGKHKRYMTALSNRDKYIRKLGEIVYLDDHYNKEQEDMTDSTAELGESFGSFGFGSSSKLGESSTSLGLNSSFSSIKEEPDSNHHYNFARQLSPRSTVVIQKDESIYKVLDKLVEASKPENSRIINIVFDSQQYVLDDIVMGALEKIMIRTIREQGRKWQVVQLNLSWEVPKHEAVLLYQSESHQQKAKEKMDRLIRSLHRNLRDEKLFNKFTDLDSHFDQNNREGKNEMGQHIMHMTTNITLVFKKNLRRDR